MFARLGIQEANMSSGGYYNLGPYISRNRLELEAAYRSNWLVGKIIDCIAEDMTREGVDIHSELKPDEIQDFEVMIEEFNIWKDLCNALKWARLYGGSLAVMLIDGANYEKELNIETIGKDKFKGIVVLDRWMVQPTMDQLVTDLNRDIGKPMYYETLPGVSVMPAMKIHYSRVLRFEGIELPYYQKLFENLWGLSVVERILDRLLAFDSATQGAAQLMYKAYLRTIGIDQFRETLAMGGAAEEAIIKQFKYIQQFQSIEGLTVLDAKDTFQTHAYSFAGISDVLQQFGQQVSGGEGIPLVRLFGQSPAGFSTGDTDIRNYYDEINKRQNTDLRPHLNKLFAVMSMSRFGKPLPEDTQFDFRSLWQIDDQQKATIAATDFNTINGAYQGQLLSQKAAMQELRQLSRITGRFTNITTEDIENAEDKIPSMEDMMGGGGGFDPSMFGGESDIPEDNSPTESPEAENPNERLGAESADLPEDVREDKEEVGAPEDVKKGSKKETKAEAKKQKEPLKKEKAAEDKKSGVKKKTHDILPFFISNAKKRLLKAKFREFFNIPEPEIIEAVEQGYQLPIAKTEVPEFAMGKKDQNIPSNTDGIGYKGYVIQQTNEDEFKVFSLGGTILFTVSKLEQAKARLDRLTLIHEEVEEAGRVKEDPMATATGITYKDFIIKQDNAGKFHVYSINGDEAAQKDSLEDAMQFINEVEVK